MRFGSGETREGQEGLDEPGRRIEEGEDILKSLGLGQVRVRMYSSVARIEVAEEEMCLALDLRETIVERLKGIGFVYVTLDLEGLLSGSLDEASWT
jgi:uncharacterized protein